MCRIFDLEFLHFPAESGVREALLPFPTFFVEIVTAETHPAPNQSWTEADRALSNSGWTEADRAGHSGQPGPLKEKDWRLYLEQD